MDYSKYNRPELLEYLRRRDQRNKELSDRLASLHGIKLDRDRWKELADDLRKQVDRLTKERRDLLHSISCDGDSG